MSIQFCCRNLKVLSSTGVVAVVINESVMVYVPRDIHIYHKNH